MLLTWVAFNAWTGDVPPESPAPVESRQRIITSLCRSSEVPPGPQALAGAGSSSISETARRVAQTAETDKQRRTTSTDPLAGIRQRRTRVNKQELKHQFKQVAMPQTTARGEWGDWATLGG